MVAASFIVLSGVLVGVLLAVRSNQIALEKLRQRVLELESQRAWHLETRERVGHLLYAT